MENLEQLECESGRSQIPGSDFFSDATKGLLLGATLTCVTPQFHAHRPGIDMTPQAHCGSVTPLDEFSPLQPPGVSSLGVSDVVYANSSPIANHLETLVSNLAMPKTWQYEGIEHPTKACTSYSLELLRRLFDNYSVIPYKITVARDGGVFFAYKSYFNQNILRVEVDNELDAVAVVSDGKKILDSGLLEADDLERSLFASFNRRVA